MTRRLYIYSCISLKENTMEEELVPFKTRLKTFYRGGSLFRGHNKNYKICTKEELDKVINNNSFFYLISKSRLNLEDVFNRFKGSVTIG